MRRRPPELDVRPSRTHPRWRDFARGRAVTGVTIHVEQVRRLFDQHAAGWSSKYQPGAPLEHRLARFAVPLTSLVPPPAVVLDLGCGTGNLAHHLAASGYHVIGADMSAVMLDIARASAGAMDIEWVQLNANRFVLPSATECFDAVVASSVLEYVDQPTRVIGECARVLRPGGLMLCTVPDPANPVRRAEAVSRALLFAFDFVPQSLRPRRCRAYVDYLRLSKNRFPLEEWHRLAHEVGLETHALPHTSGRPTLAMLAFTRTPPAALGA